MPPPGIGSLQRIVGDREALKRALATRYPGERPGTIAAWAGVLLRFGFDASGGDLLIHPDKKTRTVAFGRLDGGYCYDDRDLHCRGVRWLVRGASRNEFSDRARKAISDRRAFFEVAEDGSSAPGSRTTPSRERDHPR
jgi:predicted Mrr-cat superfamily restriction endonuclease